MLKILVYSSNIISVEIKGQRLGLCTELNKRQPGKICRRKNNQPV